MALLKSVQATGRTRRTCVHVAVQRLIPLAHLLPITLGKAVAVAPRDQLLGAELLQKFAIDLGQMHEAARVQRCCAVALYVGALAQVVVQLQLGNGAHHREHLHSSAQAFAVDRGSDKNLPAGAGGTGQGCLGCGPP